MTVIEVLAAIYTHEGIHLRELCRKLQLSMPAVKNHVDKLLKEGLIIKHPEGRNLKLYLNRANRNLSSYVYQIEAMRLKQLPKQVGDVVFDLLSVLENKPILVVVFGSYAKGTFTKTSDLDVLLVFNKPDEEAERKAKLVSSRHGIRLEPVYLSWSSFEKKFFDEKDAFMKELKENKIIVTGVEYWRELENEKA
ncbi:MAG: nucleotidyltransferase domain-containing protein [Candidatus Aenigmarchaeota archaeon]|nr:nucleotidyltransferase domain-containing protein [Candidatus Aenigmarchaeota archaeon]